MYIMKSVIFSILLINLSTFVLAIKSKKNNLKIKKNCMFYISTIETGDPCQSRIPGETIEIDGTCVDVGNCTHADSSTPYCRKKTNLICCPEKLRKSEICKFILIFLPKMFKNFHIIIFCRRHQGKPFRTI